MFLGDAPFCKALMGHEISWVPLLRITYLGRFVQGVGVINGKVPFLAFSQSEQSASRIHIMTGEATSREFEERLAPVRIHCQVRRLWRLRQAFRGSEVEIEFGGFATLHIFDKLNFSD
jgi:hypothetical protein